MDVKSEGKENLEEEEEGIEELQGRITHITEKKENWEWLNKNRADLFKVYGNAREIVFLAFSKKRAIGSYDNYSTPNIFEHTSSGDNFWDNPFYTMGCKILSKKTEFTHIGKISVNDLLRRENDFAKDHFGDPDYIRQIAD